MIKNVFFDLDGTIIDSEPSIIESLEYALTKVGYEVPDYETLLDCIGPPFSYSLPNVLHVRQEDVAELIRVYRDIYDKENYKHCTMYPGMEAAFKRLNNSGYAIYLASSKVDSACRSILKYLKVDEYFTQITGSTLDRRVETKEEVINENFRIAPWMRREETVLIGDTRFDIEGALATGITPIGVTYGFNTREELEKAGAKLIFDSIEEVVEYIVSH